MKVVCKIGQDEFANVDHVVLTDGSELARKTFSPNQPLHSEILEKVRKWFSKEVRIRAVVGPRCSERRHRVYSVEKLQFRA